MISPRDRGSATSASLCMDREVVQLLYPEYQVLAHIAGGAYGQVWLASHSDGTLRAIKFVEIGHGDPDRRYERERRGVRLLKSLSSMPDGIVTSSPKTGQCDF
jgi:hypothetical protein